jgi:hypothetical protein
LKRKTKTRRLTRNATLAVILSLAAAACAGPERPLLEQFFAASRLRDRTALQSIATVIFEPRERGIVTTFDVLKVEAHGDRRDVTIAAPVALPDGRRTPKTLVVTLARDTSGRWMITDVRETSSPR